jgi:GDPmannose 4,6-dehydratase
VVNYRERYGLFAASGILFNHESPRRPPAFVTRKITQAAAAIRAGRVNELRLGNLQARRDWGFAGDYVEAMARMLDHAAAEDFVIGSGETHSVSDFLDEAFGYLDLDWHDYVVVDPQFFRPLEAHTLQANPAKARRLLGWGPRVSFQQLVRMMVEADLEH